jgi:hypothetical protein
MDTNPNPAARAEYVRAQLPSEGLFAGQTWRTSPEPFALGPELAEEIESLGRVLRQFYRAVNLLYRLSVAGKQPGWVAAWLDQGKPAWLVELQRAPGFKNEIPRVIRPDVLLTNSGLCIVELDSVPGGIGLTAWLNQTYSQISNLKSQISEKAAPDEGEASLASPDGGQPSPQRILGGSDGMTRGFAGIFGEAPRVHIVVSEEAATYRPEMEWLCGQLNGGPEPGNSSTNQARFAVRDAAFMDFQPGDAVYRFFELFDLANVSNANAIFAQAREKKLRLTPPPKPLFEEKMLFGLLWNRNLREFWRQELGEGFLQRLQRWVPYTWIVDPTPLPPQAALPELNLTDWRQLKSLSQRERELILKISGFADTAWGARSVRLGSDLSLADWSEAVEIALASFERSPFVLQRFHKPKTVPARWFDFTSRQVVEMPGRVRLCPYYFQTGEGDSSRATLGGVLATICPGDKKIIHGMPEAILAPCSA